MKMNLSPTVLLTLALGAQCGGFVLAGEPETDGVALAIVYDTSGSMKESVRDDSGRSSPKFIVANRALMGIARQIDAFAATRESRSVQSALFVFENDRIKEAIAFGLFKRQALEDWVASFRSPNGGTPLGAAITTAAARLRKSTPTAKHILVITDGMNTVGPAPAPVISKLQSSPEGQGSPIHIHFIAFDIDAKVFNPLRKLGVTVVGAADEKQLNTQLEFILSKKILLEDEEPAKPN
jgi:hypothetical protein